MKHASNWKKQYSRARFNNEPTEEGALRDRVEKLERLVGKLPMENEFLKKGLQYSMSRLNRSGYRDRIRTGFVYLAAILDASSRKVIGYAVSTRLDTALTLRALRMAIAQRRPGSGCVIHHSDQGVQYASGGYVGELKNYGFMVSMTRTGNPYENAMMESFFKTLKYEAVYLCVYEMFEDVVAMLPYFIDEVYN
ncbi:IS3 family transposase [Chloroflexota bacterium]